MLLSKEEEHINIVNMVMNNQVTKRISHFNIFNSLNLNQTNNMNAINNNNNFRTINYFNNINNNK